jgi:membrane-bound lytic murein transglycosylase D
MNLNVRLNKLVFLPLLFTLSACGHLGSLTNKVVHRTDDSQDKPQQIENQKSVIASAEQTPETQPPDNDTKLGSDETLINHDLLQRIRAGFDLPVLDSKYVAQYEKWNTQHPTYLVDMLTRAEPFLFYILEQVEKRGLPTEIALLPAVESAFKPAAISRSNAAGLWQFVPATGKQYGLHRTWWYDGRMDAIAATNAALDYLVVLNKMFDGDWFLTLAAYNAGPGTLQKAIKKRKRRHRKVDYLNLKLRSETKRYVPKLMALKNIISDPDKYGVKLPHMANRAYFDIVQLERQIDLKKFAIQSGLNLDQLQHLNAGFLRWASPPDNQHHVLVPIAAMGAVSSSLESINAQQHIEYHRHSIRDGDSLSTIARQYGVNVLALKETNQLRSSAIRAGNTLLIPVARTNQSSPIATTAYLDSQAQLSTPSANPLIHTIVAGDTLWSIARRYQVQVAELMSWNKLLANQVLNLNQVLKVFPSRFRQ